MILKYSWLTIVSYLLFSLILEKMRNHLKIITQSFCQAMCMQYVKTYTHHKHIIHSLWVQNSITHTLELLVCRKTSFNVASRKNSIKAFESEFRYEICTYIIKLFGNRFKNSVLQFSTTIIPCQTFKLVRYLISWTYLKSSSSHFNKVRSLPKPENNCLQ